MPPGYPIPGITPPRPLPQPSCQHIVDPANVFPVGVALCVGLVLVGLLLATRRAGRQEVLGARRETYCRSGTFVGPVPLRALPPDVSWDLGHLTLEPRREARDGDAKKPGWGSQNRRFPPRSL